MKHKHYLITLDICESELTRDQLDKLLFGEDGPAFSGSLATTYFECEKPADIQKALKDHKKKLVF